MTFTEANFFTDPRHNQVVDLIYYHLVEWSRLQDPEVVIDDVYCISGEAAAIWQGETDAQVKNAIFITDNEDLFQYILTSIAGLTKLPCVKFQEKILIYAPDLFIEIHFWTDTFNRVFEDFVPVHLLADIPPQFL